jgi:hypothetical protein
VKEEVRCEQRAAEGVRRVEVIDSTSPIEELGRVKLSARQVEAEHKMRARTG